MNTISAIKDTEIAIEQLIITAWARIKVLHDLYDGECQDMPEDTIDLWFFLTNHPIIQKRLNQKILEDNQ